MSNHIFHFDCFAELRTFTDLPDGIQCFLPYDPDEILQCQLDGAKFNITTSSSNITTTSLENSSTSEITETETLESSSTSQSITSTSPEGSTSKNDKNTPLTSESTESEKTIYTTSKGSTDMTPNLTNGVLFLKKKI